MKRTLMIALVLTAFVFSLASVAAAKTITLTFANQNPDTSWSGIHAIGPWAKQVEEATGGKVKVQRYYGQTLSKGKDIWNATKMGITDIGWCFHGYWPGTDAAGGCDQSAGACRLRRLKRAAKRFSGISMKPFPRSGMSFQGCQGAAAVHQQALYL
jgi:TRAP-type mannitol/chloroaromatic compound transport system substrate-binding protein